MAGISPFVLYLSTLLLIGFIAIGSIDAIPSSSRLSQVLSSESDGHRGRNRPVARVGGSNCDNSTGKLMFCDDFDTFDLRTWRHDISMSGGGNWEFEYYSNNRSNTYSRNSTLFIRPTLTSDKIGESNLLNGYNMDMWGLDPPSQCTGNAFYGCFRSSNGANIINPVQSGLIRSINSFAGKYFHLQVRAKLPVGDWIWPAIWLLPKHNMYGDWPASGEIDLMESRGNSPSYPFGGSNQFGSTLHWGPFWSENQFTRTHAVYTAPNPNDLTSNFHIYGLVWNEKGIQTYIDDPSNVVLSVPFNQTFWQRGGFTSTTLDNPWTGGSNATPFDQEFYVLMNVAVGGISGYFPEGAGKPWSNTSPHAALDFYQARGAWYPSWKNEDSALQVDYVRIFRT